MKVPTHRSGDYRALGGCLWRASEIVLALAVALAGAILLYEWLGPKGGTP